MVTTTPRDAPAGPAGLLFAGVCLCPRAALVSAAASDSLYAPLVGAGLFRVPRDGLVNLYIGLVAVCYAAHVQDGLNRAVRRLAAAVRANRGAGGRVTGSGKDAAPGEGVGRTGEESGG